MASVASFSPSASHSDQPVTVAGLGSGKGDRSGSFRNPTWILDPEGRRANLEKTRLSKSEDIRGGKEREPEGGDKSVGLVRKKMPQKQRGRSEPENLPYFPLLLVSKMISGYFGDGPLSSGDCLPSRYSPKKAST